MKPAPLSGVHAPEGAWVVGVDIGGTNLVVGAIAADGSRTAAVRSEPTATAGFAFGAEGHGEAVVARISDMVHATIRALAEETGQPAPNVLGVGIGSPGPLNRATGVVIETPNLGWVDFPVRDLLSTTVELPASLDNDANCAAFGEWWLGAGQGYDPVVALTIGTGIGGGVVSRGTIFHGVSDAAGEIGHTTINLHGRRCGCGNDGCLEAYASGPNIAARAVENIDAGSSSLIAELVGGNLKDVTAATVYEAAIQGDRVASEVVADTAKILGAGVANLVNLFNPACVVITGGVTKAGALLFEPLGAAVRKRAFRSAAEACHIVPGELPELAGMVGAAGVFLREHYDT